MVRSGPRTYALPYPAVFDAVVAVLGTARGATAGDRDAGRVERRGRLRTVTVFVGAADTTRTTVVVQVSGALATRGAVDRLVGELDRYLGWYYRPSA